MALRKDAEAVLGPGEQPARQGRHSRPKPFGGRLRLPTLRVSGAAMAMSTVVGISIATTWLLNEQQAVGRRPGFASVGATPPPSPGADRQPDTRLDSSGGSADQVPGAAASFRTAAPLDSTPTPRADARTTTPPATAIAPATTAATGAPAAATSGPGVPPSLPPGERPAVSEAAGADGVAGAAAPGLAASTPTGGAGGSAFPFVRPPLDRQPAVQPAVPPIPAPTAAPTAAPAAPPSLTGPTPTATDRVPDPAGHPADRQAPVEGGEQDEATALLGTATVHSLGRDGTRHILDLTVTEPLTALEAEFRLSPSEVVPGTTAWTNLAGAVMTVSHENGALVYRFSSPAGADVRPGHYTFGVRGVREPGVRDGAGAARRGPAESWAASAFGVLTPRAVAALGGFEGVRSATAAPGSAARSAREHVAGSAPATVRTPAHARASGATGR